MHVLIQPMVAYPVETERPLDGVKGFRQTLIGGPLSYNGLNLDRRSRISFLMYKHFSVL